MYFVINIQINYIFRIFNLKRSFCNLGYYIILITRYNTNLL